MMEMDDDREFHAAMFNAEIADDYGCLGDSYEYLDTMKWLRSTSVERKRRAG
jgi:hypothetical protein